MTLLAALLLRAAPTPQVAVGPPTLILDAGEGFYYNPDSAFPVLPSADGKSRIAIWGPGKPTRYIGPNLDAMTQSGSYPAPVRRTPGIGTDWDSAGTWMLAANRAPDGVLVALTHVEDHTFADGGVGEWNSSGIDLSTDDGKTWTNLGPICGAAKPAKARYGGLDIRTMVWNRARKAWLGYCGAYAFESKDPYAALGTWHGYHDGAFSQRIDPAQPAPPLSEAPGLTNGGPQAATWGSMSWNAYFGKYLYVWRASGASPNAVFMALSPDGLHWEPPTTLFQANFSAGEALDYLTLVGASSALTGQDCVLVYAKTPSTGLRRKDMTEHWIHFGPLKRPATPDEVRASGKPGLDAAVTVSWKGVPMAEAYEVSRRVGKDVSWSPIGSVRSSSAAPSFVDRTLPRGRTATYRVVARNSVGASRPSSAASAGLRSKAFKLLNVASGLVLEAVSPTSVAQQANVKDRAEQGWRFSTRNGRDYEIVNGANGSSLGSGGDAPPPGTLVGLAARSDAARALRRWIVQPTGPTVALIDADSGLCLDGHGGGKRSGTPVDFYPYGGALHQQWRIVGGE